MQIFASFTRLYQARLTAILLGIATLGSGCIQMEHNLEIDADASATYNLRYAITESAVAQFRAMQTLARDLALAEGDAPDLVSTDPIIKTFLDPDESSLRSILRPLAEYGIELESLESRTRPLWRDFEINLLIDNIANLRDVPFFQKYGFDLTMNQEQQYIIDRPPVSDKSQSQTFQPNTLSQITPFLRNFQTTVNVTVPGRIISTTAGRTVLQTAMWNFEFDQQPESILQLLQERFYLVFTAPAGSLPSDLVTGQ